MSFIKNRKHVHPSLSSRLGRTTLIAGLTVSLTVSAAQAADVEPSDAASREPSRLPETKVRATKSATLASPKYTAPLAETTQTIQVVDEQVMKSQGVTTLTEAMRNVPGVGTFNAGEGNGGPNVGDALYMRGFDASNSIFLDGVRDLGAVTRDVFNVEQLEVSKGPAGPDSGRSSPAGAINLVSKQPRLDDSLDASLGVGSGSYRRATLDFNRSLPDFDTGAAFRLNVMAQDSGVAGRDQLKNKAWGIAPSLAFGLNTDTRVYLNLLRVEQDTVPESGLPTIGLSGFSDVKWNSAGKVNTQNYYGSTDSHADSTATMATVRVEHLLDPTTTLRNTTRWGLNESDYLTVTAGVPTITAADSNAWTTTRLGAAKQLKNEILTNQTSLSSQFSTVGMAHAVNAGLEFTQEKQTNYGLTRTGTLAPVNLYNPALTSSGYTLTRSGLDAIWKTDTSALYAFDTVKLNDIWQANAGVRLDHYKTTYSSQATTGTTKIEDDGDLFTYKAGVLYKISPQGNVYVNYALSQQPPGSTSSFGSYSLSSSASSATNPSMAPQKAKTYELGSKWELLDQRLLFTAAVFRTDVENEVYAEDDGTYSQVGKKRVQGVELSANGKLSKDWDVTAAYTHQKTTVVKGAATAQDGSSTLPYAPDNALSLWSTYRTPLGLTLGGGARYTGIVKRQTKLATTPDHIPAYWVFDAVASYQISKNWDAQLNVFNLLNKQYITAINYLGYRYTPGQERSARLSVNFHF